ncbi:sugar porter family MFS transporter [Facilibium subflavum]|uniref:sugar porter family MFS transporter n=1 Tax=Facilibium subflavum TaxID=2219058 RepID=UPI000E648AA6|nr:sugar porter family MFS transporter [Facilibium subflavum]
MKKLTLIAVACSISGLLFGFDAGVISGVLVYLKNDFTITSYTEGFIVGALPIGALFSALFAGQVMDYFGRRAVLFLTAALYLIGTLLCTFALGFEYIVAGRIFIGIGVGLSSTVTPLYLSELAPKYMRGKIVTLYLISVNTGIFFSYLSNYFISHFESWRLMFFIAVVPAIILFTCLWFLPESPRWLYMRHRFAQAEQALKTLYGKNLPKTDDIKDIQLNQQEKRVKLSQINAQQKRLLFIGFGIGVFTQAVGINAIIYYAPTILMHSGVVSGNSAILASLLIGFTVMVSAVLASFKLDQFGRRTMLLNGLIGIIVCLFMMFIAYNVITSQTVLAWAILLLSVIYVFFQGISVGPACFLLPAEIFPIAIRGIGMSISVAANWLTNILVSFFFPTMLSTIGAGNAFLCFAVISCVGWVFFNRYVLETNKISLEEIAAKA